jgi:hypothetical protein
MALVLRLPSFDSEFVVECDASGSGIGAVLHEGDGPITFFSRPMASRHAKLAAYECELIGLVQAVRHWRAYLWGRSFLVRTDHYSLKFLLNQRLSMIPQHQWASKLLGFDFRVEYKPGKMNVVADALSRMGTETSAEAMALSAPSFQLFEDLRAAYTVDATLTSLRQEVRDGLHGKQWAVVDDLVTRGGRICVPASSPLVEELLATALDTRAPRRHSTDSARTSSFQAHEPSSGTLCVAVSHARRTRLNISTLPVCCSPSAFRRQSGPTYPWTSLRASTRSMASRSFSPWWTAFPKWHTS